MTSVTALRADVDVASVAEVELADAMAGAAGLVNATPVGMAAHPGTPVATELLPRTLWVADIVYRPLVTELLTRGRRTRAAEPSAERAWPFTRPRTLSSCITGLPADRAAMFGDFDD